MRPVLPGRGGGDSEYGSHDYDFSFPLREFYQDGIKLT